LLGAYLPVCHGLAERLRQVRVPLSLIGHGIALVGVPFPLVSVPLPLIGHGIPLIGLPFPLTSYGIPMVGD